MGKLSKSIEIEASPEKVFAFMLDMEKVNEITKGFAEGKITSKGPIGVGTTMHYVGRAGGTQVEWNMEVTEFEKNKKMCGHTVGAGKFKMESSWIFEPTAKGTKLTFSYDYELPYSVLGKIVDKLRVSKDMEKSTEKQLEGIKKTLEK